MLLKLNDALHHAITEWQGGRAPCRFACGTSETG